MTHTTADGYTFDLPDGAPGDAVMTMSTDGTRYGVFRLTPDGPAEVTVTKDREHAAMVLLRARGLLLLVTEMTEADRLELISVIDAIAFDDPSTAKGSRAYLTKCLEAADEWSVRKYGASIREMCDRYGIGQALYDGLGEGKAGRPC